MIMLQLNPSIPMLTPKGPGLAWLVIDYGPEHNIMWTVAINATGEIWTFANPEVRAEKNITLGRTLTKGLDSQVDAAKKIEPTKINF